MATGSIPANPHIDAPMHVLHLVNTPRPFFDQQVAVLERLGIECTVKTVPGEHTTTSSRTPLDYLRYHGDVLRTSVGDFDLVHANYGLVGPVALAQPRRPVVLTLWGSDVMGHAGWLDRISRLSARLSDAVIVPSPAMTDRVPGDHELIPFGVDTDLFRPIPRDRAREMVGWDGDVPIVLFPYPKGRPEKKYDLAVSVVERIDADVDLRTLSGVPHDEMPLYMNASDVLLVTSRRESGPMVVKEAAACNVPVVSTDVGFASDTLADVSGSAVCAGEAELVAALDHIIRHVERSNGRDAIDHLGVERMGEQLVTLYEQVCDGTGRSASRRASSGRPPSGA